MARINLSGLQLSGIRLPRRSDFDFSKVGRGEWICAGGGIALFVTLFLPWFGTAPEENPFIPPARKVTVNGWHTAFDLWLLLLLLGTTIAAIATVVLLARGIDSLRWAQVRVGAMGLSFLSAVLIVYRMIDPITNTIIWYGAVLGLIAAIVVLTGTQISMVDERGYLLQREPRRRPPAPVIPPPSPGQPKKPPGAP